MWQGVQGAALVEGGAEAAAGVSLHLHLRQVSRRPGNIGYDIIKSILSFCRLEI